MSRPITQFRAMFVPCAEAIANLATLTAANAPTNIVQDVNAVPRVDLAPFWARLTAGGQEVKAASTITPLAPDILYIITAPEFSLNGRMDNGSFKYDAKGVFHELLEQEIRDYAHTQLQERFHGFSVLFAFSCATYSSALFPDPGTASPLKVASANRITVVTSTDSAPRTVTKFKPADVDGWVKATYTPAKVWDNAGNSRSQPAVHNVPRAQEIAPLELPWSSTSGPIALSFATCKDVIYDKQHGNTNMVIFLGSGSPIGAVEDDTHPFLINDTPSWNLDALGVPNASASQDTYRKPIGYYTFDKEAPSLAFKSVGQMWEEWDDSEVPVRKAAIGLPPPAFKATGANAERKASSYKCFYHSPTHTVRLDGAHVFTVKHTDAMPLPPRTGQMSAGWCTLL